MNWRAAHDLARSGQRIRRAGWVDRWLSYADYLWWITPLDSATGISGMPRVVRASDFTVTEFLASDWTVNAIAVSLVESMSISIDVPATACIFMAYASAGYVSDTYPRDSVDNCAPVNVIIPAAASRMTIKATGKWGWSDYVFGEVGPEGSALVADMRSVDASYLNPLVGSERMPNPTLHGESLVGHWKTESGDGAVFEIGAGVADFPIPDGVRTLCLGFVDGYEWSNNIGSAHVEIEFSC